MTTKDSSKPRLTVDVWSDVMCPWCYLGDVAFDKALEGFPHAAEVDVRYHSYQLMPQLPADEPSDMDAILRSRGYPREQLEAGRAQLTARGKDLGIEYHFDKVVGINTRAAHRLTHFAKVHGKQHEMVRRLFRAHFTEGLDVGNHHVLADLAAEVGLERAAALDSLTSGAFDDDVTADLALAREIGVSGVPFFVLVDKLAVSGAQSVGAFRQTLDMAWKEMTK